MGSNKMDAVEGTEVVAEQPPVEPTPSQSAEPPANTEQPALAPRPSLIAPDEPTNALTGFDGEQLQVGSINDITIEEIQINSTDDILRTLSTACGQLSDESWINQVRGLKMLRFLASRNYIDFDGFQTSFESIVTPLSNAVSSLRSALSREACSTVSDISHATKSRFNPFAAQLFPAALRLTCISNKAVAASGLECLQNLSEDCDPESLIPSIAALEPSEGFQCRAARATCLDVTIRCHPKSSIEPFLEQIELTLAQLLPDGKPKVRTEATKAFKTFVLLFPDNKMSLMGRLDPSTQKRLDPTMGVVKQMVHRQVVSDYALLFDKLDMNKDGNVSVHELMAVLQLNEQDAMAFLRAADSNGDGVIDRQEFCDTMSLMKGPESILALLRELLTVRYSKWELKRRTAAAASVESQTALVKDPQPDSALWSGVVTFAANRSCSLRRKRFVTLTQTHLTVAIKNGAPVLQSFELSKFTVQIRGLKANIVNNSDYHSDLSFQFTSQAAANSMSQSILSIHPQLQ
eukprot:c8611_g1_i1.p1 GENE.c8611_g1_i1~~c8611_g1_i1.p1  ORF type:complete len:519 (-),score=115.62 c8611_g1_i1:26-1582(-)